MSTFSLSSCPLLRRFIDLLACSTLGLLAGCASVDGLGKPLRHG
jgi:predicted small secreted protein